MERMIMKRKIVDDSGMESSEGKQCIVVEWKIMEGWK